MTANKMALDALIALYRGYVNTLQAGRDRIIFLGGECDTVEKMEASDPWLISARAAIAALQAEPQGWMPIETAPKDGTRILVCNKANYVYPARWQGVESGKPADWPQGWRDDVMFVAADGIVSWMPLPSTPPKD